MKVRRNSARYVVYLYKCSYVLVRCYLFVSRILINLTGSGPFLFFALMICPHVLSGPAHAQRSAKSPLGSDTSSQP